MIPEQRLAMAVIPRAIEDLGSPVPSVRIDAIAHSRPPSRVSGFTY